MKAYSIFIALLFLAITGFAQKIGGITGKIIDEHGQPVEDAIVTVIGNDSKPIASSITDKDGNYRVRPVKPGHYNVRVTERFHEVKTFEDLPVYNNKFVILDVTLTQPGIASRQVIKMVKGGAVYSYVQDTIEQ